MNGQMGARCGSKTRIDWSKWAVAAALLLTACLAAGCSASRFKLRIEADNTVPKENPRQVFVYFVPADDEAAWKYAEFTTKKIANNPGLHETGKADFIRDDVHQGKPLDLEVLAPGGIRKILLWGIFDGFNAQEDTAKNPGSAAAQGPVMIDPAKMVGGFLSSTVSAKITISSERFGPPVYK